MHRLDISLDNGFLPAMKICKAICGNEDLWEYFRIYRARYEHYPGNTHEIQSHCFGDAAIPEITYYVPVYLVQRYEPRVLEILIEKEPL